MSDLRQAAQALLDRWDSPLWKTGTTAAAIADLRAALEQQAEPVALEAVYETIIYWDEGGGKRSRRELAKRIVDFYTAPPQRKPLTDEMRKQMKEASDSFEMRGAFANGWLSAEAAHHIQEPKS